MVPRGPLWQDDPYAMKSLTGRMALMLEYGVGVTTRQTLTIKCWIRITSRKSNDGTAEQLRFS